MIDHGLDLGIIGNGRVAALVDPGSRIVWWCYPRFDGDPIFCRLVSGKEEKGFSDVVLEDMVDFQSQYIRNSAIICTVLTDRHGGKIGFDLRMIPGQALNKVDFSYGCLKSRGCFVGQFLALILTECVKSFEPCRSVRVESLLAK